jgi:hypothetical protein
MIIFLTIILIIFWRLSFDNCWHFVALWRICSRVELFYGVASDFVAYFVLYIGGCIFVGEHGV